MTLRRTLDFSKRVKDFLEKIDNQKHASQIYSKLNELRLNPKPLDSKELKGHKGIFRVDVGEYRICYSSISHSILILLIGKRNDSEVYKKLKRITKSR